ncbi:MAG: hypothetical protein QM762_12460 [Chryseolinea sp.]
MKMLSEAALFAPTLIGLGIEGVPALVNSLAILTLAVIFISVSKSIKRTSR